MLCLDIITVTDSFFFFFKFRDEVGHLYLICAANDANCQNRDAVRHHRNQV